MKTIDIGKTGFIAPEIALGLMHIKERTPKEAIALLETALSLGINYFDHADIYGRGECEEIFAKAILDMGVPREKIILQSKCGITQRLSYDFSKEHILKSVDGILKRLHTDYLDVLLLHRPDALMDPCEVATAFDALYDSGKVKRFGVSNQYPMQIELLKKYLSKPLIINQLQLSVTNTGMIDCGINVNMENPSSVHHDGGVLDYSRLCDMTIQAWSPLTYGFFEGNFIGDRKFAPLNRVLNRIASEKGVTPTAIAIAWILRHPAKIQTIVGTTSPSHLLEISRASDITISHDEWYEIYRSAGNNIP
ncbi:MAG: aldo/keto reductase [Clostridia bacterium]